MADIFPDLTAESMLKDTTPLGSDAIAGLAKQDTLSEIAKLLNQIDITLKAQGKSTDGIKKELESEADDAQSVWDNILNEVKDFKKEIESGKSKGKSTRNSRREDKTIGVLDKLAKALNTKTPTNAPGGGGIRGGGSISSAMRSISPVIPNGKGAGAIYGVEFSSAVAKAVESTMGSVMIAMWGGASAYKVLSKGMIQDEYEYLTAMNQIAYQTQAITGESYNMQKSFRKTEDVVKDTGYGLTLFQNQLVKTTRKGIKDAQTITKTGLGLGKMMGLSEQEAVGIADTFGSWNQNLGLSSNQLSDVSRGIQETSRYTGITGEGMVEIVKSSEQFMAKMKSAGTLTAAASKNIIDLQANAKKLGVGEQMSEVMGGMTSAADLLLNSSSQTQTLLISSLHSVGRMGSMWDSSLLETKAGLNDLAEGMENVFKRMSGGVGFEDIDKMDAKRKSILNMQLVNAYGKSIEDLKRMNQVTKESGMTFQARMDAIDASLGKNATAEEKLAAVRKKSELFMSKSLDFSSKLSEAANGADNFGDAISNMKSKMGEGAWADTVEELSTVAEGISKELAQKVKAGDATAQAMAMGASSAHQLKKAGGTDFTGRVEDAIKNNNMEQYRTLTAEMDKEQKRMGIKTISATDPFDAATQQLKQFNETLRSFTSSVVAWTASSIGSTGILVGLMATMVAQGAYSAVAIKQWGGVIKGFVNTLLGKKIGPNVLSSIGMGAEGAMGPAAMTRMASTGAATTATAGGAMGPAAMARMAASGAATAGTTAATTGAVAGTATAATGAAAGTAAAGGFWSSVIAFLTGAAPYALIAGVIVGGIGAAFGNIWAGEKAAEIMNVQQEKLTTSQYYAAKGAGMLTGALNALTLGIFNSALGTTGTWTKSLAKLNEKIPILSAVAAGFDVLFGVIWGTMKAIGNIFMGIGEMIYYIIEPIGEAVYSIGESIGEIISPIMALFMPLNSSLAESGSLFKTVSDSIGALGGAIRWLLKRIGKLVGFIIKVVLSPLVMFVKGWLGRIKGWMHYLIKGAEGLITMFSGLFQVIQGIFTFDFNRIWQGIKTGIFGLGKFLLASAAQWFLSIPQMILTVIRDSFAYLGSMFDNVEGPLGAVLQILTYGFKLIGAIADSLLVMLDGAWDLAEGLISFDGKKIMAGLTKIFCAIPVMLYHAISNLGRLFGEVFGAIPKWLLSALKAVFIDLPNAIGNGLSNLGGLILDTLSAAFSSLPTAIGTSLSNIGGLILDALKAVFVDLPNTIAGGLASLGGIIMGALTAAFIDLPMFFGKLVADIIYNATTSDAQKAIDRQNKLAEFQAQNTVSTTEKIAATAPLDRRQSELRALQDRKKAAETNIKDSESRINAWNPMKWDYVSNQNNINKAGADQSRAELASVEASIKMLEASIAVQSGKQATTTKITNDELKKQTPSIQHTEKAIAHGEKKGSLYVHDIHSEKTLNSIGKDTKTSVATSKKTLNAELKNKSELKNTFEKLSNTTIDEAKINANAINKKIKSTELSKSKQAPSNSSSWFSKLFGSSKKDGFKLPAERSPIDGFHLPTGRSSIKRDESIVGGLSNGGDKFKLPAGRSDTIRPPYESPNESIVLPNESIKLPDPKFVASEATTKKIHGMGLYDAANAYGGPDYALDKGVRERALLKEKMANDAAKAQSDGIKRQRRIASEAEMEALRAAYKPAGGAAAGESSNSTLNDLNKRFGKTFNPKNKTNEKTINNSTEAVNPNVIKPVTGGSKMDKAVNVISPPLPQGFTELEDETSLRAMSIGSAMAPTQMVTPSAEERSTVPAVQPRPLTDVRTTIQREHTQSQGDTKKTGIKELSEIITIHQEELSYMKLIHEDMQKMVDLLTPDRGSSRSGMSSNQEKQSTRSKIKPINSPNYHQWQFGKYDQNASQQVITDGR